MMTDYELCAAYAEGNVSPEEREAARHYLAENPDMMESVLFAMGVCRGRCGKWSVESSPQKE